MKTRDIVMLVVVAVIFVAATTLTIWGIVTHEEPVFTEDTNAWEHAAVPLPVRAHQYTSEGDRALDDEQQQLLRDVLDTINTRLGFIMLRSAQGEETALITVDLGVPHDDTWEGPGGDYTLVGQAGVYTHCTVRTSNTGTNALLFYVLQHELGHCMGLAHDSFTRSIMYPEQRTVTDLRDRPWITDADRKALRGRYQREL